VFREMKKNCFDFAERTNFPKDFEKNDLSLRFFGTKLKTAIVS